MMPLLLLLFGVHIDDEMLVIFCLERGNKWETNKQMGIQENWAMCNNTYMKNSRIHQLQKILNTKLNRVKNFVFLDGYFGKMKQL